ncbi:SulP family inorganic anion transporter [Mucisphaera sp.]|uniref:SulP family inorganic anion transporter n=1 Tax=Mucisphaera sp. TaxID=2913024 RepID=UPI003D129119
MRMIASERFREFSWRGDLFGGVTTAVISLPLALAFGVASGAGAQAGLYGAVCVGLFAALFGGTRTLISEPTGPMTVVMTAVITTLHAADPDRGLSMAFAVVLVAGLTQVLFGFFKLGRYITLMPYSVISGFMSGIGVLLILMQLAPMSGQASPGGGAIGMLQSLPELVVGVMPQEVLLAGIALVVLFLMPQSWRRWCPPHLLALLLGTVVGLAFFAEADLRRIGEIPMGLPAFQLPVFTAEQLSLILFEGMILGVLGCIDTLLTAMIADSLTRKQHDSDRELIGQGVANLASGLFGGLPGAGATMGTVVNIQVGAKSPVAAIIRALILLLIVLVLAPLLESIPMAVLAAIAFKVGFDILDWSFLKRAHHVSRSATLIMYGVMSLTVFVDLIVAVGVGVFVANILTIDRLTRLQASGIRTITTSDEELPLTPEERVWFERGGGQILLLHLSGPMIFGVAKAISREHEALKEARVLVLDLLDVPLLSTTVALALENVVREARAAGVPIFICANEGQTRERLSRFGQTGGVDLQFYASRVEALKRAAEVVG